MLILKVARKDMMKLDDGLQTKINGEDVTVVLDYDDESLNYTDGDGVRNCCKIIQVHEDFDGHVFYCASHEQDPSECEVITP